METNKPHKKATLDNLHLCTEQEVFDTVVEHLYKQGKPSISPNGQCLYRSVTSEKETLMCAAGILMPNDRYYIGMEGRSWKFIPGSEKERTHMILIGKLQEVHDSYTESSMHLTFLEYITHKLQIIANEYNLIFSPPS